MGQIKKIIFGSKIIILISILVSLLLVKLFSTQVFIANTPRISPKFIAKIANLPQIIISTPFYLARSIGIIMQNNTPSLKMTNLTDLPTKRISTGVYAGEATQVRYFKVVQDEIEWKEIELHTRSGKIVKFKYPKDQPPTQEMLNIIKSE